MPWLLREFSSIECDQVYDPLNCSPFETRLLAVTHKALYVDVPLLSRSVRELARLTPGKIALVGAIAVKGLLADVPSTPNWLMLRSISRCVPLVPRSEEHTSE